jgi:hypothetical protein
MKRRFSSFLIILIGIALISGCTQATTVSYLTGEQSDLVAAQVEPIAREILSAIENNNYDLFVTHFDETMRKAIDEDQFSNIVSQYGKYGAPDSVELLNIEDQGNYYSANFGVNYPEAKVIMRLVVSRDDPSQVSGLWFK